MTDVDSKSPLKISLLEGLMTSFGSTHDGLAIFIDLEFAKQPDKSPEGSLIRELSIVHSNAAAPTEFESHRVVFRGGEGVIQTHLAKEDLEFLKTGGVATLIGRLKRVDAIDQAHGLTTHAPRRSIIIKLAALGAGELPDLTVDECHFIKAGDAQAFNNLRMAQNSLDEAKKAKNKKATKKFTQKVEKTTSNLLKRLDGIAEYVMAQLESVYRLRSSHLADFPEELALLKKSQTAWSAENPVDTPEDQHQILQYLVESVKHKLIITKGMWDYSVLLNELHHSGIALPDGFERMLAAHYIDLDNLVDVVRLGVKDKRYTGGRSLGALYKSLKTGLPDQVARLETQAGGFITDDVTSNAHNSIYDAFMHKVVYDLFAEWAVVIGGSVAPKEEIHEAFIHQNETRMADLLTTLATSPKIDGTETDVAAPAGGAGGRAGAGGSMH